MHWDPFLHAWIVTRYADVVHVLHRLLRRPHADPRAARRHRPGGADPHRRGAWSARCSSSTPPAHTPHPRAWPRRRSRPAGSSSLRAHIHEITDRLLDAVERRGRWTSSPISRRRFPASSPPRCSACRPRTHRQLKAWSADFAEMLGNFQHNPDRVPRVLRSART